MHPSTKAKIIKEKKRTINKLKELSYHPEVKDLAEKMMKDGVIDSYKVGVGVVVIEGRKDKKEVELVRGEVYTYNNGEHIFRFKEHGFYGNIISLYTLRDDNSFYLHCNFSDMRGIRLATPEEKAKLIQAEQEHGKYWDDEKKDFLKLEDVCYEFDNMLDLVDINNIREIHTWKTQTNKMLCKNRDELKDYSVALYDGELRTMGNLIHNTNRISVPKQTFINILKHETRKEN